MTASKDTLQKIHKVPKSYLMLGVIIIFIFSLIAYYLYRTPEEDEVDEG